MAELNAMERPTPRDPDVSRRPAASPVTRLDTQEHVRYSLKDEVPTSDKVPCQSSGWIKDTEAVLARSYKTGQKRLERLAHQAGRRIRHAANEKPIHVIATVAGLAFATGLLLRVWRSNHYE
ncbi:MAG: hypothetical protein JWO91_3310 [Acidobacteriaceae bacterium]|jgi:hypothetical protein|nr:hypothetical protein [Acidobacteriaceae bacterium]